MVSFILPGNSATGGYEVANSCRFDRASSASMNRSMSDGSSIKSTFSAWVKVDGTDSEMNIMSHFEDTNNVFSIVTSGSSVYVADYNSGYSLQLATNRIMRDPSAWFHLYVAIDRSQGTASNRNRIFINGTEETSFAHNTNYSQQTSGSHENAISMNDGDCTMYIGQLGNGNQYVGGYLAEVVYLDGTVSDVTNFGEFDDDSPTIWKPIDVSGLSSSKGTNGFYLDFEDSSNLGNCAFGGTDFTEANLAATDQSTDTCTNNYATLNPLHFGSGSISNTALSEGNLKFVSTQGGSPYPYYISTMAVSQGKWYAEFKFVSSDSGTAGIGNGIADQYAGNNAYDYSYYFDGRLYNNGSGESTGYSAVSNNDIIGCALDLDNNKIYFHINGSYQASGDPANNTGGKSITAAASNGTGVYHFEVGDSGANQPTIECNFGNPPFSISSGNSDANGFGNFEYSVPSGYYALNTSNLNTYG